MSPALFLPLVAAWVGFALLLDRTTWARATSLAQRLAPYRPDITGPNTPARVQRRPSRERSITSTAQVHGLLQPLVQRAGLSVSTAEVADHMVRVATIAALIAGSCVAALQPGWVTGVTVVLGVGVATIATKYLQLLSRANDRSSRLASELPVVAEQLGMLLADGFSLTAALQRLTQRGNGLIAAELAQVVRRIRQGESELVALDEWAQGTGVPGAQRLTRVLRLHRQAGDLGHLISEEARSVRAEHHRSLVESISRRSQLVWIPVTIATLVPGLVVLAVPFASAMTQITGS
ncbi:MAG: type II secretion system F family protein [Actinomycetes bacterium]